MFFTMNKNCLFISQLIMVFMLSGCLSISHFQAWSPTTEFEGQGGACITKDGIDIYSAGTPKKKCQILGIINTTTITKAELMAVFGNSWSTSALIKEAKARGGNAIILTDRRTQILGWSSSGTATAYQNGNTATAYGSSHTSATVSGEQVAVLVKYVGEVQEQNLTPEIEAKLLGHWLFVPTSEMPLSGHLDYYFLPNNRCKMISSLIDTNGQPFFPTQDQEKEGRYYFTGNKLVTWGDKEEKPKPPKDFSVTDTQLTIRNEQLQLLFQKQTE
jgi:hypothetical protein